MRAAVLYNSGSQRKKHGGPLKIKMNILAAHHNLSENFSASCMHVMELKFTYFVFS